MIRSILVGLAWLGPVLPATASDQSFWPEFRGANGSGISASAAIPEALDAEHNLAWKLELKPGYSSPIIGEFEIIVTCHDGKRLFTTCIERDSGEIRWQAEAPKENDNPYPGPNSPVSSTPALDANAVYVLYPCYGLVAYDLEGEVLWQKAMGPFNVPHVMSTSPILAGDLLILQCDQDSGSFLVALDKASGEERWRTDRPRVTHGYSTPVIYHSDDGDDQIITSGAFEVSGYSVETGEKLWWVEGMAWQANTLPIVDGDTLYIHSYIPRLAEFGAPDISEPFAEALAEKDKDGDGKISREEWPHEMMQQLWFLYDLNNDDLLDEDDWNNALRRGSSEGGLFAIKLGGTGDLTESAVEWNYSDRRAFPDFSSPLLYDGILYTIKDGGLLTAINPQDGSTLKQGRIAEPDKYYASLIAGNGRIVAASHSGQLTIIEAGSDWQALTTHSLDEELWATPALSNEQVVVRTQTGLYCFESSVDH